MGSFNVACGISNLTIHEDDEIGFLIIVPEKEYRVGQTTIPKSGKTMNVYNTDEYNPLFAPVFGKYGDYGRIENITETPTTALIEAKFNRPIQEVVNCVGNHDRALYSSYGPIFPTYFEGDKKKIEDYQTSVSDKILSVGFKRETAAESSVNLFSYDGFLLEEVEAGKWRIYGPDKPQPLAQNIYERDFDDILSIFGETTKRYPGFNKRDWVAIETLYKASGMYFLKDVFYGMKNHFDAENAKDPEGWDAQAVIRLKEGLAEMLEALVPVEGEDEDAAFFRRYRASSGAKIDGFFRKTGITPDDYASLVIYKNDIDDFFNISDIVRICMTVNRMIAPTVCGEQFGNDAASRVLNGVTDNILAIRKKQWDDEYDEDEE